MEDFTKEVSSIKVSPKLNPNEFGKHSYAAVPTEEGEEINAGVKTMDGNANREDIQAADESEARNLARHLKDVVIPAFIQDVQRGNVVVSDGEALKAQLHARGINIRYIGHIAVQWIRALKQARKAALKKARVQQKIDAKATCETIDKEAAAAQDNVRKVEEAAKVAVAEKKADDEGAKKAIAKAQAYADATVAKADHLKKAIAEALAKEDEQAKLEEEQETAGEQGVASWEDVADNAASSASSTLSSYFLRLLELEMIARTVRHSLSALLRDNRGRSGPGGTGAALAPGAIIAAYIRRLLSSGAGNKNGHVNGSAEDDAMLAKRNKKVNKLVKKSSPVSHFALLALSNSGDDNAQLFPLSPLQLWAQIKRDVFHKFSYCLRIWPGISVPNDALKAGTRSSKHGETEEDSSSSNQTTQSGSTVGTADRLALLRRVCQLLGVSVASRAYNFDVESSTDSSANRSLLPEDILGVSPVVKHGFPKCHMREVNELIDFARAHLSQRRLGEAHTALQDALVYLYQAVGVMHEYVAMCCTLMAKVYSMSAAATGDDNAEDGIRMAILYERRALCAYERLKGFDSYQVMQSHNFLATLLTRAKHYHLAAKHMIRYIYLQRLALGSFHAEENSALIKLGSIYQGVGRLDQAVRVYDFALRKCMERGDSESLEAANCRHLLARCFHLSSQHRNAILQEQIAYQIFKAKLGPQHKHTLQCAAWLRRFADVANKEQVDAAQHKKELKKQKMRSIIEEKVRIHRLKQDQMDDYIGDASELLSKPRNSKKKKKKSSKRKKGKKR